MIFDSQLRQDITMNRRLFALAAAAALAAGPAFAAPGSIVVTDAWARATPSGAPTAAAYLTITNRGSIPDRLLGGETTAARTLQVHEMSMTGGVMHMGEVKGAAIAPGATLKLQPGGWHIMLIGLKAPLVKGASVPVTLHFEKAGAVRLVLPVKDAPMGGMTMRR
jgi:copper(I)-binding protein